MRASLRHYVCQLETGGLFRRLVDWGILASLFVFAFLFWGIGRRLDPAGYLGAKLTYLSVVIALGIFQYRLFMELVWKEIDRLHNPEWMTFRARVEREGPGQPPHVLVDWNRQLHQRDQWEKEQKQNVREGVFPHNIALLSNIFAVLVALLLSVVAAVLQLLLDRIVPSLRSASTALFLFSFVPVAEMVPRYVTAFYSEIKGYGELFKE